MLIAQGHQVDVAFNIVQEVNKELVDMGCEIYNLEFQRSPLNKKNILAFQKLKDIIKINKYDLIHTHTPIASAYTRIACRKQKNITVIYTAHGFHFYKGASFINWLLFYPVEKWLSNYTDVLITINKEDYERAKSSFNAKKVKYIPGVGLNICQFNNVVVNRESKRKELGIPNNAFLVLSVGELNKNKNHETIIKAIARLNNPKIYYVICGNGPLHNYLENLSKKLGLEKQVKLLGYRNDIAEICKASDVFAFPSQREGLGLAALEAMATGLPIVTSNVHGIVDYSVNKKTGYTCKPSDVKGFSKAIFNLINDRKLMEEISINNINLVKRYDLNNITDQLSEIYNGANK